VTSEEQKVSMRGPAVLLALLLSVLLGAPAPAALADPLSSGLRSLQPDKSTPATRTARRAAEDQADLTDLPDLWLGGAPRVATRLLSIRPAAAHVAATQVGPASSIRLPFQARAPPAA
jgi:hypothetical protein